MLSASVDGLLTTFLYDGNGNRLQLTADGETTTYLPDYTRRNRTLFEQTAEESKHYLYGTACLGEYVTDNATNDTKWRYYLRDGSNLVRQTTNQTATITLAWAFSPNGGIILGEDNGVSHLSCKGDGVYDWSTGLIFKNGKYFDPSLDIWLIAPVLFIWPAQQYRKRRKGLNRNRKLQLFSIPLLLLIVFVAIGGIYGWDVESPDECLRPPTWNPEFPDEPESPLPVERNRQETIWAKLPVITTNPWTHTYGNTVLAHEKAFVDGEYGFSGGLHGGFDLGGSYEDTVIAGTRGKIYLIEGATKDKNTGEWEITNEDDSAIYINPENSTHLLKYQHFASIKETIDDVNDVNIDDVEVDIDTELGTVGNSGGNHIHLEVREGTTNLHNPLLYFSPELYNILLGRIDGKGNVAGETFYQNSDKKTRIPWDSAINQPTIPQSPGYRLLTRYFGVDS